MQEIDNLDIGDKVKHPKFGTGTVVFRTGEGDKQKATVKFGSDVGEKKLLVSLAKLKVISERPTLAAEAPVEAVAGRSLLGKAADDDDDDKKIPAIEVDDDEDEDIEDLEIDDDEVIDDEEVVDDDEEVEIEDEDDEPVAKPSKAAKGKKNAPVIDDEEEVDVDDDDDDEDEDDDDDEEIDEDEE